MAVQIEQEVSSYGYLWRDLDNAANHVRVIVVMRDFSPIRLRLIRGRAARDRRRPVTTGRASHDGQHLVPTRL